MKNLLAYYYVDLLYLDQALFFGLHACIFSSKMCPKFSFIMCVSVSSENIRLFFWKNQFSNLSLDLYPSL